MIQLTEEMSSLINRARDDGYPCIVATASDDGTPNCGYIGTVLTVGDDTLIYRDRTGRNPLDHIEANPKVIVLFPQHRAGYRVEVPLHCLGVPRRTGLRGHDRSPAGIRVSERALPGRQRGRHRGAADRPGSHPVRGAMLQEREPGLQW